MQKDVTNLKRMYINDFLDFQELIRNNDIGYNNIVRLIFDESAGNINGKE